MGIRLDKSLHRRAQQVFQAVAREKENEIQVIHGSLPVGECPSLTSRCLVPGVNAHHMWHSQTKTGILPSICLLLRVHSPTWCSVAATAQTKAAAEVPSKNESLLLVWTHTPANFNCSGLTSRCLVPGANARKMNTTTTTDTGKGVCNFPVSHPAHE